MSATRVSLEVGDPVAEWLYARAALWKVLVYLNLTALSVWGSWTITGGIALGTLVLLLAQTRFGQPRSSIRLGFFLAIIAVVVAIPIGSTQALIQASEFSTRLLSIVLLATAASLYITVDDMADLVRLMRLPHEVSMLLVAMTRYIPVAERNVRQVLLAQRSRGLYRNWKDLFAWRTYESLAVPFIVSVFKGMVPLWVSLGLRPPQTSDAFAALQDRDWQGLILFGSSLLLWWL